MHIGVIGAGKLGATLAEWCAESGHDVAVTSRHPERLADLADRLGDHVTAMPVADAAAYADAVLFAPSWSSAREAIDLAGGALDGKVVIDATNPPALSPGGPTGPGPSWRGASGLGASGLSGSGLAAGGPGASGLSGTGLGASGLSGSGLGADGLGAGGRGLSGLETLMSWAPEAHWVKAFNTLPASVLARRRGHDPLLAEFVCTDRVDARRTASKLIRDLGFAPVFAGRAEAARLTETGGPLQMSEVSVQDATDVLAHVLGDFA
jgi:8-hydroxy-5-deazaflavin:NADPH oxidoreductase